MNALFKLAFLFFSLCYSLISFAENDQPTPTMDIGVSVFQERCVLCHGKFGLGEGYLPLAVKNYPDTNLMTGKTGKDLEKIREAIIWGGSREKANSYSPPWGDELTWTEIESVTMFVQKLRADTEAAQSLLKQQSEKNPDMPNTELGRVVYENRCIICHGESGKGDGKMSKIIKDPPPFNLTASIMPDDYLQMIIVKGGEAVGRSKHMPPWGEELSDIEISSLIRYINQLRNKN